MSSELCHRAIHSLFNIMNERELNKLRDLFGENVVFHFPGTTPLEGISKVTRFIKVLFKKFPQLTFTLNRIVADDTRAAAEWTNKGISKSGERYENAGVTFIELNNGKIIYMSDTFKNTSAFL